MYNSPTYKDDRFYVYVPVRVNPEQPVTGTVPGVVKVAQGARSLTLYGLSDESRSLRGTDGYPCLSGSCLRPGPPSQWTASARGIPT